jgi:hypothetical protein
MKGLSPQELTTDIGILYVLGHCDRQGILWLVGPYLRHWLQHCCSSGVTDGIALIITLPS